MTRIDRRRPFARSVRASFLTLTALAVTIGGCGKPEPLQMPPPEVLVAPVAQRDVPIYSEGVGTIEGYVTAEIRPA